MIRIASTSVVLAMIVVSTLKAIAGPWSHQAPTGPRALGRGVFLSIDESHVERRLATNGMIEAQVTLSNRGATPLKMDELTFSLSNAAGDRSLALLPSELHGQVASPNPVRAGVLESDQTLTAVLYFRSFSSHSLRPLDLRVDLTTEDGQAASRSFLPFALN